MPQGKTLQECNEEWRVVEGFEDYLVSNKGRIMKAGYIHKHKGGKFYYAKERVLKLPEDKYGYRRIGLTSNGTQTRKFVHRLVANAFIENPLNKPYVNHKNGNKSDNRVENLEWCTHSENSKHAQEHHLCAGWGSSNIQTKLTVEQVKDIRANCIVGNKKGLSLLAFAKKYGVGRTCVWAAYYRQTYRDVI